MKINDVEIGKWYAYSSYGDPTKPAGSQFYRAEVKEIVSQDEVVGFGRNQRLRAVRKVRIAFEGALRGGLIDLVVPASHLFDLAEAEQVRADIRGVDARVEGLRGLGFSALRHGPSRIEVRLSVAQADELLVLLKGTDWSKF